MKLIRNNDFTPPDRVGLSIPTSQGGEETDDEP